MNKKKKRILTLLAGVVILFLLLLPKFFGRNDANRNLSASNAPRDQRTPVQMEVVHSETLGEKVLTVGTVLANEEVEIRSEISGKIEKIFFKEGRWVKKGEVLLKINDDELQAQLLRAQYRQALVEEQAERQRQLFDKQLASQEEYDIMVSELNIRKAETQLIQVQIDKTEIRAPFEARVGLRWVSEGSYLSPQTLITTLQDIHPVKIDFTVPEKYASQIKVEDQISFTVQGIPGNFSGTIYSLESKIDPTTRTLRMRALSPNPDGVLIPGAYASIEVVMKEKETLMIPAYALIPELKGHRVFLYKEGKALSQQVKIGTRTDQQVEIVQGLQVGDTLITSAILQLRPGMPVQPILNPSNR